MKRKFENHSRVKFVCIKMKVLFLITYKCISLIVVLMVFLQQWTLSANKKGREKSNSKLISKFKGIDHVAWLENSRRWSSHAYILTLIRIQALSLNPFVPFAPEIRRVPRVFHKIYIRKGGVLSHVPIARTPGRAYLSEET